MSVAVIGGSAADQHGGHDVNEERQPGPEHFIAGRLGHQPVFAGEQLVGRECRLVRIGRHNPVAGNSELGVDGLLAIAVVQRCAR